MLANLYKSAKTTIWVLCLLGCINLYGQAPSSLLEENSFNSKEIVIKLKNLPDGGNSGGNAIGDTSLDNILQKQGTYNVKKLIGDNSSGNGGNATNIDHPHFDKVLILKYDANIDVEATIKELMATGLLVYAEPNYIGEAHSVGEMQPQELVPNDYENRLYWAKNDGTFKGFGSNAPAPVVGADIDATDAWSITTGNSNIILAILDSGIDPTNKEFENRLLPGYDFVNEDNIPNDDESHGSNVTGLATMTGNNGFGLAGMDWKCKIMPLKVLNADNRFSDGTDVAQALIYAADNGANVINMSLGFSDNPTYLHDAIKYAYNKGVTMVASMGNGDATKNNWPASYSETIAVGATDLNDYRVRKSYTNNSWGSNSGNHIDLVAPGNWMVSARHIDNQNFNWWKGGTSMSTPLVSGTATLLLSVDPTLTPEEIRTILRSSADDEVGDPNEDKKGFDIYHGAGRLNAHKALLAISGNCTKGAPCDDGDDCTTGETYGDFCICQGGTIKDDADNDGVCNIEDVCPNFDDNLIGKPCNDNDPCTVGETYDANCGCSGGVYQDKDFDGLCAYEDPDDNDGCNPNRNNVNCLPCVTYNFENFNSGSGIWNNVNGDANYDNHGSFCASGNCYELDNGPGDLNDLRDTNGGMIQTKSLNFSNRVKVKVKFSIMTEGIESGESFVLQISKDGGNSFSLAKQWKFGNDFSNNRRYNFSHTFDFQYLSSNNVIRLRAVGSHNGDNFYVDDVDIEACTFDGAAPSCTEGASCNDNNPKTINDRYLASCLCVGTYVSDTSPPPPPPADNCTRFTIPGKIEAESYCRENGTFKETTTDAGGGQNIGGIAVGDWMEYNIDVQKTANYTVNYRVASAESTGGAIQLQIKSNGIGRSIGNINLPGTGGWQNFTTVSNTVSLTQGAHILRVQATGPAWNLNWLSFKEKVDCNTLSVSTTEDQYYCQYEPGTQNFSANAAGGTAPYTYEWSNGLGRGQNKTSGSTETNTFTVAVTDVNGCTAIDDITIFIEKLTVETTPDQYYCQYEPGTQSFSANAAGGAAPYTYEWSNGLGRGQYKNSGSTETNTFTVTVTDANGCTATNDITIFIEKLTVETTPDQYYCQYEPGTQSFSANAAGGAAPYTYEWSNGLGRGQYKNSGSTETNTFTVTVTDANGCTATDDITIFIEKLTVETTPDQYYCQYEPGTQNFSALAMGGKAPYTYEWSNGLGSGRDKTAGSTTTNTFTVTVTDANGCTATDDITIFIDDQYCPTPSCTVEGGTLTGGPFNFCVGDGTPDYISNGAITLRGNKGAKNQWLVTDANNKILGLLPSYTADNFDGASPGICLIYHVSYDDGLTGLATGNNISQLDGCFSLSNSITINRQTCVTYDCPSLNANIGATCNDGNPNTSNDRVQADCTCAGDVTNNPNETTVSCDGNTTITYGNGTITMSGQNNQTYFFQIFDKYWSEKYVCGWQCGFTKTVDLPSGEYRIYIKNEEYQVICEKVITLSGSSISIDNDNDGVIAGQDCDDNDANLTTVGAACNDNNPNTSNDRVNANCQCVGSPVAPTYDCPSLTANIGDTCNDNNPNTSNDKVQNNCTCAGTPNPTDMTTESCGDGTTITYGNGSIIMTGASYYLVFDMECNELFACGYGCGTTQTLDNLPIGDYRILMRNNQYEIICEQIVTLSNSSNDNTDNSNGSMTSSCGDINITYGEGTISLVGETGMSYYFKVNDINNGWAQVMDCAWQCGHQQEVTNLPNSKYIVTIYNTDWSKNCETEIEMTNSNYTASASSRNATPLDLEVSNAQLTVDDDSESITIYPNPAQELLNINTKPLLGKKVAIRIINNFGQVVYTSNLGNIATKTIQIPLENAIPTGFYKVFIEVEGQKSFARKLIIKK